MALLIVLLCSLSLHLLKCGADLFPEVHSVSSSRGGWGGWGSYSAPTPAPHSRGGWGYSPPPPSTTTTTAVPPTTNTPIARIPQPSPLCTTTSTPVSHAPPPLPTTSPCAPETTSSPLLNLTPPPTHKKKATKTPKIALTETPTCSSNSGWAGGSGCSTTTTSTPSTTTSPTTTTSIPTQTPTDNVTDSSSFLGLTPSNICFYYPCPSHAVCTPLPTALWNSACPNSEEKRFCSCPYPQTWGNAKSACHICKSPSCFIINGTQYHVDQSCFSLT